MPSHVAIAFVVGSLIAIAYSPRSFAEDESVPVAEQVEFFEARIRPVLVEHCYECHSAEAKELKGELMLDNRAAVVRGGESGPIIVNGDPDASRLILALRHDDDDLQMPPKKKLPDDVIADFVQWIRSGATDPRDGAVPPPPNSAARHWAFQLPRPSKLPKVKDKAWPRDDIDYFVLARLEQQGISASPAADPRTLVRRLHLDLVGLPPSYEEVREFADDPSDEAVTRIVDRLLASSQFGERWARHWLDVSRYSDTKGYVFKEDRKYPNAFKYRDWVVDSLNADLPYDQFLMQQIAADRLVEGEDRSALAAMGFLTLGRRFINNTHDIIDDRIDVVFRGLMGLTVTCARCHDHKYDPISTQDYYGLYGVFASSSEQADEGLPPRLVDKPNPSNIQVFLRGNPGNRGEQAPRRFLRQFENEGAAAFSDGSGRLELARAIASRENPLTARVLVNRVWSHLMGAPLVHTSSDFGLRSDPPVHRDVLDQLATRFMEDGWSIKRLIRRIVLSSVYRQCADRRSDGDNLDPENMLLWRANRRRLDFEAMRDSLLAVSGKLDSTIGGESVRIDTASPSHRRTLYAYIDRQNLPGMFRTFDFANPDTHSPHRPFTTVPQQALYLMNNPFAQQLAKDLAQRVADIQDPVQRVQRLFQLVFARDAVEDEVRLSLNLIEQDNKAGEPASAQQDSWPRLAQTLLLTNEFLFLD